jgi:hypothetical protein
LLISNFDNLKKSAEITFNQEKITMKSKILLAVIGTAGLAGLTVASYGQGRIFFDNYDSIPYASHPVVYGNTAQGVPPSLAGTLAGSNVNVELGYFIGTTSDPRSKQHDGGQWRNTGIF